MTLQRRLFLLVIISLVPVAVLLGYNEFRLREARDREFREQTLRQALLVSAELERIVDGARQLLLSLAELSALEPPGAPECAEIMNRLMARFPRYVDITAVHVDGSPYCSVSRQGGSWPGEFDWYRRSLASEDFEVGDFHSGGSMGQDTIHFAYPIRGNSGGVKGVLGAALSIEWLRAHFDEIPKMPQSVVTIADREGMVVVRTPDPKGLAGSRLPTRSRMRDIYTVAAPTTADITGFDGVPKIASFVPMTVAPGQAFDVAVAIPNHVVTAELNRIFVRNTVVILLSLGAALLIAGAWGTLFVRRPVDRLIATLAAWSAGDRSARADAGRQGTSEFARLADGFNRLMQVLHERERDLILAKEKSETASRAKSLFLAHVSHELRTPLNAILGFSQTIRDAIFGPLPTRYQGYGGDICAAGTHLLKIIDDVLDLSRIEAERLEIRRHPVDLAPLVRDCCTLVEDVAQKAGVTLTRELEPGATALGDDVRLKQIVLNLLSNAVKFTLPGGEVTASVRSRPDGRVDVIVGDTGIGMNAEEIATALEPFGQVDSMLSDRNRGTGLGLPLAARLTALQDGVLSIDSEPERGTRVTVTLRSPARSDPPTGPHSV